MSTYLPGQVVKIHRPNKSNHGHIGRFLTTEGAIEGCAWVCFSREHPRRTPPDRYLRGGAEFPRKLLPLSQIQAV